MAKRKAGSKGEGESAPTPPTAPLLPRPTGRFERDVKRLKRRGMDMGKFKAVVDALCSRKPLPPSLRDHGMRGEWEGCRDCHVTPDWIIIYERGESTLTLHRTGTHADLFE